MSRPGNGTRLLPLALAALLLGGCATPDGAEAPPASVELRGHLILGPQERAFRPCNSADSLWLLAAPALDAQLQERYLSQVDEPYEEAYLHLRGQRGAPVDCSACAGHAGSLRIEQLIELRSAESADCR